MENTVLNKLRNIAEKVIVSSNYIGKPGQDYTIERYKERLMELRNSINSQKDFVHLMRMCRIHDRKKITSWLLSAGAKRITREAKEEINNEWASGGI